MLDLTDKYIYQLIPKFTLIARGARLISTRLTKMIIGDGMTFQEKYLLTEMLFNQEAVLAYYFIKMGKVRKM